MLFTINNPELFDYYQSHLVNNFLKKSGKATVIPHLLNVIQDNLKNNSGIVRILDIGCGTGHLLSIISQAFPATILDRIEFHGLDYDEKVIQEAKKKFPGFIFYCADITRDIKSLKPGSFDVIVSINTFHEVYSEFLVQNTRDEQGLLSAKNQTRECFNIMNTLFKPGGNFIFYDGLAVDETSAEVEIDFQIKSSELRQNFNQMIASYTALTLDYQELKNGDLRMRYDDFNHFISTFKYFGTPLWYIEAQQSYGYFSAREFRVLMNDLGITLDSLLLVNNDINLWQQNVQIVKPNSDFPLKAILLSGKKVK